MIFTLSLTGLKKKRFKICTLNHKCNMNLINNLGKYPGIKILDNVIFQKGGVKLGKTALRLKERWYSQNFPIP